MQISWLCFYLNILKYLTSRGIKLALVFSTVRCVSMLVEATKNQLADPAPGLKSYGKRIGIVKFKRDLSFKTGVDPAGVLNKKPDAPDGAAAFDEGGEVIGQPDKFHGGGEQKGMGRNGDFRTLDLAIENLSVEVDHVHLPILNHQKIRAQPAIYAGGLDRLFVEGGDSQLAALDQPFESRIRKNHFFCSSARCFW